MASVTSRRIRSIAGALAASHLVLALGAGFHHGHHVDGAIAQLPADLHHHAYGFVAGSIDDSRPLESCVACQLSRWGLRLPPPPDAPLLTPTTVDRPPTISVAEPRHVEVTAQAPRAPPQA